MTAISYVILGKDDNGNPVRIQVIDSGETDGANNKLWLLNTNAEVSVGTVELGPGSNTIGNVGIVAGTVDIGNVGREATQVGPLSQSSTNSYADVAGSTLDTLNRLTVCYTIRNTHVANSVDWQILGANAADFSDSIVVALPATVASSSNGTNLAAIAHFRYYKVQIKSTSPGSAATTVTNGITKG